MGLMHVKDHMKERFLSYHHEILSFHRNRYINSTAFWDAQKSGPGEGIFKTVCHGLMLIINPARRLTIAGAAPGTKPGPAGGPRSCTAAVELQMFFSRLPAGGPGGHAMTRMPWQRPHWQGIHSGRRSRGRSAAAAAAGVAAAATVTRRPVQR